MIEFIDVDGLGRVRVSRRRGSRSIRLSVTQHGEIRLSMPMRLALREGLAFLEQKRAWLQQHKTEDIFVDSGARIGKAHTLVVQPTTNTKTTVKITADTLFVNIPEDLDADAVHKKITAAATRVLTKEAEALLPQQLLRYARQFGFSPKSVSIRTLHSRWGSCSNRGDIVLNSYLMQLPWALIDYVIIHELTHLHHHNHSDAFWKDVAHILPDYKARRKALKKYPTAIFDARESERFA